MASKANWHSPSAAVTSVILFFCVLPEEVYQFQTKRIGTAALANDLEEMNYFSISFGHFLGFQWVAAAVEKVHSIQSTIWSVLWRIGKTYCPLIFIYTKNGWKSAQISVAFVIVLLVVARQKSTALSKIHHAILRGKSLCHIYITSHYVIQNVKYLSFWQLSYFAWVRHMYQIVCMNLEGLLQS